MKQTQLAFIAFLLTTVLSQQQYKRQTVLHNVLPKDLSQRKSWTPIQLDTNNLQGPATVFHFDSLNADLVAKLHDNGDKGVGEACFVKALTKGKVYGSVSFGFSKQYCVNSTVAKINEEGSVLFIDGDQGFFLC